MAQLVTQAEYARQRGVSRAAVCKAIASGRITGVPCNGKVMIDPAAADVQWARNTDLAQQERGAPAQFEMTQRRAQQAALSAPALETSPAPPAPDKPAPDQIESAHEAHAQQHPALDTSPLLVQEKTDTERVRRHLLEMELAEKRGELVRLADVEFAYAMKLAATRDALEGLPDRLAAQLAAIGDAAEVHEKLTEEIRLALLSLIQEAPRAVN